MPIEPYYERDGITLYLGDCRDVLPQLEGEYAGITDPPYNAGKNYGAKTNDRMPWPTWCAWWDSVLDVLLPVCPNIVCATLSQTAWREYTRHGSLPPDWTLVWGKPLALSVTALPFMPHWEPIACWTKAKKRSGYFWGGDVLTHNVTKNVFGHPTEKPLPLLLDLVARFALPVLDPFAGSGTALVAAKMLGLPAVGIEINERYAEIAVRRLGQTMMRFSEFASQEAMAL